MFSHIIKYTDSLRWNIFGGRWVFLLFFVSKFIFVLYQYMYTSSVTYREEEEEEEEEYFIDQLRTHKGHSNYND